MTDFAFMKSHIATHWSEGIIESSKPITIHGSKAMQGGKFVLNRTALVKLYQLLLATIVELCLLLQHLEHRRVHLSLRSQPVLIVIIEQIRCAHRIWLIAKEFWKGMRLGVTNMIFLTLSG